MARNEEKNFTILNRLYLENQAKLSKDKRPERPNLNTLTTAKEVKRWIPGIKWEINFCLHHLSGIRNYPDYKIREFQERLEQLKGEYKRWVKRCLELDPDTIGTPGNPHIYHSKRTQEEYKMRKRGVQTANPNAYTKLYHNIWQVQQAQADNPPPPPPGEEDEDAEYPEDGGYDYFEEAGGIEGMPPDSYPHHTDPTQFPPTTTQGGEEEEDTFATPLAVRPDGYTSDDDNNKGQGPLASNSSSSSNSSVSADPNDPQNQPLSFSVKKRDKPEDYVFTYSNKRPNINEGKKEPEVAKKETGGTALGLASLAAYGSDDE